MEKTEAREYIIAIACSDAEVIALSRFTGTEDAAAEELCRLVALDREADPDSWDMGTEAPGEVERFSGWLTAYGNYDEYHIIYTAAELDRIKYTPA